MEELKKRIQMDGKILEGGILKVDNFLNHQMDVRLMDNMGKAFAERFADVKIDKILTIEASGIAVAIMAASHFNYVPVVFAKKAQSSNMDPDAYQSDVYSFTKKRGYKVRVAKSYLKEGENVLIIDDFLAFGNAAIGLIDIVHQASANVMGIGIVIEKSFQEGAAKIKEKGIRLESLAVVERICKDKGISFR